MKQLQQIQSDQQISKDLWQDWILFKKNDYTNPSLQLKKQGTNIKNDQYGEFTYRASFLSPPSMQEFYESVINGIIKRFQLGLYQGEFFYYFELQNCLHEFIKLLNFKSEILVEVFQSITNLNLSKESFPNIVVPCASCGMYIYIQFHCKSCYSSFYCDKTCQKNNKIKHEPDCLSLIKMTPAIIYPLQVEIHCGGNLADDIHIYFQSEKRLTQIFRGQKFLNNIYKLLLKNRLNSFNTLKYFLKFYFFRWLKNNGYNIVEDQNKKFIRLEYQKRNDLTDENKKQENKGLLVEQQQDVQGDPNLLSDEDLYLKMPCIQELRVIFLNQGSILQDIIKENYNFYTNFVHIYYYPI